MPAQVKLEPPVLYLDAASPLSVAGLQRSAGSNATTWRSTGDEASVGLFGLVDGLLREASLAVADLRTIVFCEGPGSLLGVRLTAMAIRTWQALPRAQPLRVLGYRSLSLIAADLLESGQPPPFTVISDARRATWNRLDVGLSGEAGSIVRWPAGKPFPGEAVLFHSIAFPHWQPLPDDVKQTEYRPAELPRLAGKYPLLRAVTAPDSFLIEMPTYREWPAPGHPATERVDGAAGKPD